MNQKTSSILTKCITIKPIN